MENEAMQLIGQTTQLLAFAGLLALIIENIIEFMIKPTLNYFLTQEHVTIILPYVTNLFGVIVAVGFNIDLISYAAQEFGLGLESSLLGEVVTGLILSRVSNLISDKLFKGNKK